MALLPILRRRVVATARHIISYDSRGVTTTKKTKKTPVIHILGAGAIGMFLAASLRLRRSSDSANNVVRLLVRDDHAGVPHGVVMPIPDRTVCLLSRYANAFTSESTPRLVDIPCRTITGRQYDAQMIETLLVTTKAHDAIPALQSVFRDYLTIMPSSSSNDEEEKAALYKNPPTVIILCNGALAVRDEWLTLQQQQQQQQQQQRRQNKNHVMVPVSLGTISHGVYRADYGSPVTSTNADPFRCHQIVHAGMGDIWLEKGQGDDASSSSSAAVKVEILASALDQSGLHCRVVPDPSRMQKMLWKKLAANCVINPLTTIYDCPNGELLTKIEGFESDILPDLVREVYHVYRRHVVMAAHGPVVDDSVGKESSTTAALTTTTTTTNGSAQQNIDKKEDEDEELREWQDYVLSVISATAANQSSMLMDMKTIQHPDARGMMSRSLTTEIDYLNGYVVKLAKSYGLSYEKNEMMTETIHSLTRFARRRQKSKTGWI